MFNWYFQYIFDRSQLLVNELTITTEQLDKGLPQANLPLRYEISFPFCLPHLDLTSGAETSSPLQLTAIVCNKYRIQRNQVERQQKYFHSYEALMSGN